MAQPKILLRKITISLSRKVNLGNYESLDIFHSENCDIVSTISQDEIIGVQLSEEEINAITLALTKRIKKQVVVELNEITEGW